MGVQFVLPEQLWYNTKMPYKNKEQQKEYQRLWMQRRRNEWFANKSCVVCNSNVDLQLDHIDESQKVSHRIWSWSKPRREAELQKCQVLCRIHHEQKTRPYVMTFVRKNVVHGSRRTYDNGCRCILCKCFLIQYNRDRRRGNKFTSFI